jgi:hypothetical protein
MPDHDPSYKLLFSHREMVADLIRGFVHEDWVRALDFDTLQRAREACVSHDLREREDDMIWRVRLGDRWLYLYLLLEFQSSVDRFMAVRVLTYIGLLYQDLEAAGEIPSGSPLPPVFPIVLYNGEARWWSKTDLAQLADPDLPVQLRYWQPRIRYLLLEERGLRDDDLPAQPNLAAALFRLEQSRSPEDLQRVLASLIEWLQAPEHGGLRRAFVVWLKRVLLPARVPGAEIPNVIELQEMQSMLAERVKTWTEQWKQAGVQEGMHLGESKLLRRQLVRRFGPLPDWVEQRLEEAKESDLEYWAERVLECTSLEEVFGSSG